MNKLKENQKRTLSGKFGAYFSMLDRFFLILLSFLLIGLGIILLAIYQNFREEKLRAFENEGAFIVKLYSNLLSREISNIGRSLQVLARNPAIVNFDSAGRDEMKSFHAYLNGLDTAVSVIRVDEKSRLIFAVPENNMQGKLLDCKHFTEMKWRKDVFVSPLHEIFSGSKSVHISAPLLDSYGSYKGSVGIVLNLGLLAKNYLSDLQIRGAGRAWIVDGKGNLILSPVYSERAMKVSLLTEIRIALLDELQDKKDGITRYTMTLKGKDSERVLCFSKIPLENNQPWFICLDATMDEIQEALPRFEIMEGYFLYPVLSFLLMSCGLVGAYWTISRSYAKMLRDQLLHSQRMEALGIFVNGLAHDFNNIVQLMSGIAYLLRHNNGQATESDINLIEDLSKKSYNLTSQLVNFSKRKEQETVELDVNKCISDTLNIIQYLIGKRIILKVELCPEPAKITANPSQIEEILLNLCINAHDAMPGGGSLTIRTELVNSFEFSLPSSANMYIKLSVIDTGVGIPKQIQKRIFDPFFSTKGDKGTGLGLSTAMMIVERLDGEMRLQSEEGKGTSFHIFIPLGTKSLDY